MALTVNTNLSALRASNALNVTQGRPNQKKQTHEMCNRHANGLSRSPPVGASHCLQRVATSVSVALGLKCVGLQVEPLAA